MADYLSGEMPIDVRQRFDRHLTVCPNCARYLTSYEESVKLGKRAFDDETAALPSDVPEGLVKAILAARSRSSDPK
jgi:anti-sigma factor RsiW